MKILTIFTLICILTSSILADDGQPEKCSISTKFAMQVGKCFLKKFEGLIDMIGGLDSPLDDAYAAEIPDPPDINLSIGSKDYGRQTQSYVLKSIVSRLKDETRAKFSEESLKAQEHKAREEIASQILEKVDFEAVQKDLAAKATQIMGLLVSQPHLYAVNNGSVNSEVPFDVGIADLIKIVECVVAYDEIELENSLKWVKCAFECSDLPVIGQCMHTVFDGCKLSMLNGLLNINMEWLADMALRVSVDYLDMDTCFYKIEGDTENINITEGGPPAIISISPYLPPGVHCMSGLKFTNTPAGLAKIIYELVTTGIGKCNVELELSLSNYLKDAVSRKIKVPVLGEIQLQNSVCPSGKIIRQSVFRVQTSGFNTTTGTIQLNDTNWNETFVVEINAAFDNKKEFGGQKIFTEDSLTVRLRAGLLTKDTTKISIINNRDDVTAVRTCWTISDPHIKSFDGHYYNNLYEGYFYLYKHESLPYEVQVVYQRCGPKQEISCTCAASVRFGDDVFTVDWCRRKGESDENRVKRVTLYLISKTIYPGTRIIREDDGLKFKVILPHGQLVTIASTDGWLNVWVRPSAYDKEASLGMCGYLDGDSTNDLRLPDGSIYVGEGDKTKEQPKPFIKAWRVPEEDIILKGTSMNSSAISDSEPEYCSCTHVVILGAKCSCGPELLASICDHETSGELTDHLYLITRYSLKQFLQDHPDEHDDDLPDVDTGYEPEYIDWSGKFEGCDGWIYGDDPVQDECNPYTFMRNRWKTDLENQFFMDVCSEDAKISGDYKTLSLSSRMAARQYCYDYMDIHLDTNLKKYESIYAIDCPNDCSPHISESNTCNNGTCTCVSGFMGPDCSIAETDQPLILMPDYSYCDQRYSDCSFATIYGKNLVQGRIACSVKASDSDITGEPLFLSPYQVACELPSVGGNYIISLTSIQTSSAGVARASSSDFEFRSFDSLCRVCDSTTGVCKQRKADDFCEVDGHCYAPGDVSSEDECYYCDPAESKSSLTYSDDPHCEAKKQKKLDEEREWEIRVIVACTLSAVILACTILAFAMSRKSSKTKNEFEMWTGGVGSSTLPNDETDNCSPVKHTYQVDDHIYDIPGKGVMGTMEEKPTSPAVEEANHVPNPSGAGANEINAKELAEFWQMKQMAAQRARTRTDSIGSKSSSIGSTGIGGSSHLGGASRVRNESMSSLGMGAAGPAHMGRFARRAYSNSSMGLTDEEDQVDVIGIGGGGTGGTGFVSRL